MKIVYLCHFSNSMVRQSLDLKDWKLRNRVLTMLRHDPQRQTDYAIWNTDFISEFEKHHDIEFHIVSPHNGMKKAIQYFMINGIYYHFYKDDGNLLTDFLRAKLRVNERTEYKKNRKIIKKIISNIQPNLIVLCGAECTPFAISILDVENIPTYVLLQTCANLQKYIDAGGIVSNYGREIERRIFEKSKFFGTIVKEYYRKYIEINPHAICLPIRFPSHQPSIHNVNKIYDFVFFGRIVANKGIEEVIKALSIVLITHPKARLNIIGTCLPDYKAMLLNMIQKYGIIDNVEFSTYFEKIDDLYYQVQKSRFAVLPGITAPLNSTVRESMFMRMPTIVFENDTIANINANNQCLLTAEMLNTNDLATKMLYAIEHPQEVDRIADNAYHYAQSHLSNTKIGNIIVANMKAIVHFYEDEVPILDDMLYDEKESV